MIGHIQITRDIFAPVEGAVERHIIEYGIREFLAGNYGEFEQLGAAKEANARFPDVKLCLMPPCLPEKGRALPDRVRG